MASRSPSTALTALLALLPLGLAGCPYASSGPVVCFDDQGCPTGYRCVEGVCEDETRLPDADAGATDASEHRRDGNSGDADANSPGADASQGDRAAGDTALPADAFTPDQVGTDATLPEAGADANSSAEAGIPDFGGAELASPDSAPSCDPGTCPGSTNPCFRPICDGQDTCAIALATDGTPCPDGVCVQGSCEPQCFIDDTLIDANQLDPLNACRSCQPVQDPQDYRDRDDGAPCDDGLYCSGSESCQQGVCVPSGDPCSSMSGTSYCLESGDSCVACLLSSHCLDDGLWCDGDEICLGDHRCGHSGDPCDGQFSTPHCLESGDSCVACLEQAHCPDDGLWCNGSEYCSSNSCARTGTPCSGIRPDCVEANDSCVCNSASCPVGFSCSAGHCQRTLTITLANGNEDALQDPPPGNVLLTWHWMSLYSTNHVGGLRFQVPEIPRSATIVSAYLNVYVDSTSEDSPDLNIYVEDSTVPAAISATAYNLTLRPLNTASVRWLGSNIGSGWKLSPNIKVLVQTLVDKSTWLANRRMMFIWIPNNNTQTFEFRNVDYSAANAARLVVTYRAP